MGILDTIATNKFEKALDRFGQEITYIAHGSQTQYVTTAFFREIGIQDGIRYGELQIRQSVILAPQNLESVVINSVIWRVERLLESSAGISVLLLRTDERVKV